MISTEWLMLIWLFLGGLLLMQFPKRQETVYGNKEVRWTPVSAVLFVLPYILWATFRKGGADSLLSSKLQKNMSEKWLLFKKATFSDCIEVSFL